MSLETMQRAFTGEVSHNVEELATSVSWLWGILPNGVRLFGEKDADITRIASLYLYTRFDASLCVEQPRGEQVLPSKSS